MSFAKAGTVVRPTGSDRFWPPIGTHVDWSLTTPIFDIATQVDTYALNGWLVVGTIGNNDHLKLHGDHTPWSVIDGVQKVRGKVYAVDFKSVNAAEFVRFRDWLIATCKTDYDTTWIDFFNILGSQYDFAGNRVATSTDQHCHISVNKGYESKQVNLFNDYLLAVHPAIPTPKPIPQKGNAMRVLKLSGNTSVWFYDSAGLIHIPSVPIMNELLTLAGQTEPQIVSPETLAFLANNGEVSNV